MGRVSGSVCRLCRAEGMKLFLKGSRCYTEKCAMERKDFPPGMHGQRRRPKDSDFGLQLREKQKVKRMYGVMERQFRFYFRKASRSAGATGAELLKILERRLDNVVYRTRFASSRSSARQWVGHGCVYVNDRKINVPNYQVSVGDTLRFRLSKEQAEKVKAAQETLKDVGIVPWLEVGEKDLTATVKRLPERSDIQLPIQEQLIVELYSK